MSHCQFCNSEQHTMLTCNHLLLDDFEYLLKQKKIEYNNSIREFNNWLLTQEIILIQTFAVSKCGATMAEIDSIQNCCDIIIDTIWAIQPMDFQPIDLDRGGLELLMEALDCLFEPTNQNILVTVDESTDDLIKECSICYEEYKSKNSVKLDCEHTFCKDCIVKILKTKPSVHRCAMCRHEITQMTTYNVNIKDEIIEHLYPFL
jgi:hypothetical protein